MAGGRECSGLKAIIESLLLICIVAMEYGGYMYIIHVYTWYLRILLAIYPLILLHLRLHDSRFVGMMERGLAWVKQGL